MQKRRNLRRHFFQSPAIVLSESEPVWQRLETKYPSQTRLPLRGDCPLKAAVEPDNDSWPPDHGGRY